MADADTKAISKKRQHDTALMPPPPMWKRQKRPSKVLDEDVYTEALSSIIARDFFPGLQETQAQEEYIEALSSKNNEWIREAGKTLTQVMTPVSDGRRRLGRGTSITPRRTTGADNTPRAWETPVVSSQSAFLNPDDFAPESRPEVDTSMSLGAFQAKYSSEDNESFNALLDKQNDKRATKYAFFHQGNKIPTARQIAYREKQREIADDGKERCLKVVRGQVFKQDPRPSARSRPSQDLDLRPASLDSFPNRQGPHNDFMFGPDGVEDHMRTYAQDRAEASNAPPRSVKYTSTRFPITSSHTLPSIPPSPSMSAIDAAIAGRPRPTASEPGYSGAETPRVNGYAFVDAEPTPSELGLPVSDEAAEAEERDAAARLLPRLEEGGPNPFKINEQSKRENLLSRLVEKADANRRKGGKLSHIVKTSATASPKTSRTSTPRFSSAPSKKIGVQMTPLARQLALKIGTPSRCRADVDTAGFGDTSRRTPAPKLVRKA